MLYNAPRVDPQRPAAAVVRAPLSVGIIVLPRFSLMALGGFLDVLGHAADDDGLRRQERCSWTIMGVGEHGPVPSCVGVEVAPWERLGDPQRFDHVVLIGGDTATAPASGDELHEYLHECTRRGVQLVAVGSGVHVLAAAGLLTRRRCCVHWSALPAFEAAHPACAPQSDQLFIADDGRITCAGEAAAADLALWLVERSLGAAVAQLATDRALMAGGRRGNSAQPQPALDSAIGHERVRRAVILMQQRLHEPYEVPALAKRVNLSKRQLERLFTRETGLSVQAFSRQLRLRHGLWKLLHTEQTVTAIAQECGFADSSHFCRKFAELFGDSPLSLRRTPAKARALYEATACTLLRRTEGARRDTAAAAEAAPLVLRYG
jgi:transcriptional regulator GlxA family with amidase domain